MTDFLKPDIEFLIADSELTQPYDAFKLMLRGHEDADLLVLAHGYMGIKPLLDSGVIEWFAKNSNRQILFLIGLHGTDAKQLNENKARILTTFKSLFREWDLPINCDNRIYLYCVAGFHAKFSAVCKTVKDDQFVIEFAYDQKRPNLLAHPIDAIIGSSNLTYPAFMGANIEFDVRITPSATKLLGELSSKMHSLLTSAIEISNVYGTDSHAVTCKLTDMFNERLVELKKEKFEAARLKRDAKEFDDRVDDFL